MSVESVFKSSHPEVVAAYDKWTADSAALREFADTLSERFGGREVMARTSSWAGKRIVGLSPRDDDRGDNIPAGLRLGVKEGYLCPDKRTKAGRELAAELRRHVAKKPTYLGMPEDCWADGGGFQSYIYHPGSFRLGDEVWVTWGCSAERLIDGTGVTLDTGQRIDTDVWEHVPLSVYHAKREAGDLP